MKQLPPRWVLENPPDPEQAAVLAATLSVPPALARQCRLVSWDDNRLVFHAAGPVWKNKLRLHSQEVLAAAQLLGLHARKIRIKVALDFTPNTDPTA